MTKPERIDRWFDRRLSWFASAEPWHGRRLEIQERLAVLAIHGPSQSDLIGFIDQCVGRRLQAVLQQLQERTVDFRILQLGRLGVRIDLGVELKQTQVSQILGNVLYEQTQRNTVLLVETTEHGDRVERQVREMPRVIGKIHPLALLLEIRTLSQVEFLDAISQVIHFCVELLPHDLEGLFQIGNRQESDPFGLIVLDRDENSQRFGAIQILHERHPCHLHETANVRTPQRPSVR